jgi:hypothetical protein
MPTTTQPTADVSAALERLIGKPVVIALERPEAPFVFATGMRLARAEGAYRTELDHCTIEFRVEHVERIESHRDRRRCDHTIIVLQPRGSKGRKAA